MEIKKSTRHPKIIGTFGEHLISNWLSRSGFEVAIVDHTGLDIVAYNLKTKKRLGVTVKSRTRNIGKERTSVNVFSCREGKNDRQKLMDACVAFSCEPWIGVYVETANSADVYLTSLDNYDKKYRKNKNRAIDVWSMGKNNRFIYEKDPKIWHIKITFVEQHRGDF